MKTNLKLSILVLGTAGVIAGTVLGIPKAYAGEPSKAAVQEQGEKPSTGKQPAPSGKVAPWEAIKIALGKVPGRPLNANFEFDEGHWVYGVMIVSNGTIQEVEVDPNTGKIGDVEKIEPAAEAKEVESELTKAIKDGSN